MLFLHREDGQALVEYGLVLWREISSCASGGEAIVSVLMVLAEGWRLMAVDCCVNSI